MVKPEESTNLENNFSFGEKGSFVKYSAYGVVKQED